MTDDAAAISNADRPVTRQRRLCGVENRQPLRGGRTGATEAATVDHQLSQRCVRDVEHAAHVFGADVGEADGARFRFVDGSGAAKPEVSELERRGGDQDSGGEDENERLRTAGQRNYRDAKLRTASSSASNVSKTLRSLLISMRRW